MPADWPRITVGALCDKGAARIQTGPFGSQLHSHDYQQTGIPVVPTEAIGRRRILNNEVPRVSEQTAERLARHKLQPGDILFARRGVQATGLSAIVESRHVGWLCGTGAILLRLNTEEIDAAFLSFAFSSDEAISWLQAHAVGAVMPNLNEGVLRLLPFYLPPIHEQRAIARVLSTLDDKIELNRRMNETLEAMVQALFKEWFAIEGALPHNWRLSNLPDEIDFLEGPGLRNWQYRDTGMKFLNIRCVDNDDLDLSKANAIGLEEFQSKYAHFALREDDIVISTSGTLGRSAIVRRDHLPVMLNTSIIRMRGRGPVGLTFLWCFLKSKSFLDEMFALAAGSVQLNFGPMHLRKISMLRPPDALLRRFEECAQPLLRRALTNRLESRTLAALRDSLLPKLLSGELRVREVEKAVQELA